MERFRPGSSRWLLVSLRYCAKRPCWRSSEHGEARSRWAGCCRFGPQLCFNPGHILAQFFELQVLHFPARHLEKTSLLKSQVFPNCMHYRITPVTNLPANLFGPEYRGVPPASSASASGTARPLRISPGERSSLRICSCARSLREATRSWCTASVEGLLRTLAGLVQERFPATLEGSNEPLPVQR